MKIIYNACFGGFGLSEAAMLRYAEIKGFRLWPEKDKRFGMITTFWKCPPEDRPKTLETDEWHAASMDERIASDKAYSDATLSDRDIDRADPVLVQVVEELGDKASGKYACLKIADVPAGERYRIDEYDGSESVKTVDDYEWKVAI